MRNLLVDVLKILQIRKFCAWPFFERTAHGKRVTVALLDSYGTNAVISRLSAAAREWEQLKNRKSRSIDNNLYTSSNAAYARYNCSDILHTIVSLQTAEIQIGKPFSKPKATLIYKNPLVHRKTCQKEER